MKEICPQTRVIFLLRDFRDVFCSIRDFNARRGFAAFGREQAESDEEHIRRMAWWLADFRRELLAWGPDALLIRYEDLIRRPEDTLDQLFEGLGLDAHSELIADLLARASAETADSAAHRTSPTAGESIGRWRSELSPGQRETFRAAFGDLLEEFGYEPDGEQPPARTQEIALAPMSRRQNAPLK
jgi:hypothetical protein